MIQIAIGADHGGYKLKERLTAYLKEKGYDLTDFGTHSEESVDYPPIALDVSKSIQRGEADYGILICSTGIGMSIAANKVEGVRAALCTAPLQAEFTRRHNNANVLCFGAKVTTFEQAQKMCDLFLETPFEGGRHQRRIDEIADFEHERS